MGKSKLLIKTSHFANLYLHNHRRMRLIENYLYQVFIDTVWKTGLPRTIFQPLSLFIWLTWFVHRSCSPSPSSAFPATFVIFAARIIFTLITRKKANRMCACFKSLLQKQMFLSVTTFWELQDEKGKSIGDKGGVPSPPLTYTVLCFFL